MLKEMYCLNNEPVLINLNCSSGICKNGACIADKEPYCSAVGTRSEGWYQYKNLLKYTKCNGAYALCKNIGSKSEGWYSSADNSIIKYEICGKPTEIKEAVTCIFDDITSKQECYSEKGRCTANPSTCICKEGEPCKCPTSISCVVDVRGKEGEKLTWKSTCGGYAYTVIDGRDEYARFSCYNTITK